MKYLFRSYHKQPLTAVPKIWAKSWRNNYEGFDFSVKMQATMQTLLKRKFCTCHLFLKNLLTFSPICYLTNLTTIFQTQATHPQVLSWNLSKFWFQASCYYTKNQTPASVCMKFIIFNQKWRKLPLRISSRDFIFLTAAQTLRIGRHGLAFSTKTPI